MAFSVKTESGDDYFWVTNGDFDPDEAADHLISEMQSEAGYIYYCEARCHDTDTNESEFRPVNFERITEWCNLTDYLVDNGFVE